MTNRAHVLVFVASILVLVGCGGTCDLKVTSGDAAKRAVIDYLHLQLPAETRLEVSPLLILTDQVKEFGDAGTCFYEVRRENLTIGGNIDRLFWVNAETGTILLVHPRWLGKD
jgi:hypothetical protein